YPANQRPAGATATLTKDGTVVIRSATHETGTGTYTAMTQFAADALGIPVGKVRFELGDSQFPEAPTNGGSWLTASVSPAVMGVCEAVKKKVTETGGPWPNEHPEQEISVEFKAEPNKEEREKFSFQSFEAIFA